ncbi:MAG: cytochrome-c oxidase, cbb3-type subunit III [Betaproteobacteria bacterium]|nr:cytochrome-c oxidase, cbb3-type subunit III [Betaproteobacteria bacterium]
MNEFTIPLVGILVAVVTLVSVIGCAVFLWSQESVPHTLGKTTGHSWDENLEEYNNPLPKWWSWLFYGTIVFSLGYLFWFPGLGNLWTGYSGWTSIGQHADEETRASALLSQYRGQDIRALAANANATDTGRRLFMTYCMQCHGSDAGGKPGGFPNLADRDWLFGGEPEEIRASIADGRRGVMTPNGYLGDDTIRALAHYVMSVNGLPGADAGLAARGRDAYMRPDVACRTCHGEDMRGNKLLGAPNLVNKSAWLYGSSEAEIIKGITFGRNIGDGQSTDNRMPAWGQFLGEDKVNLLAAYVYSLN